MFRLTALPRDILLHLLQRHFTVQELIQLRSLCVEVYQLVQYCLERRRTLKLFFSFTDLQFYSRQLYCGNFEEDPILRLYSAGPSNDDLLLSPVWFDGYVVDLLVDRLFPNVRHLIICLGRESILIGAYPWYVHRNAFVECVCYMLHKMSPTLTGLSLFGNIFSPYDSALMNQIQCQFVSRPLIQQINTMQHLRRLDLCIRDMVLRSDNRIWQYMDNFNVQQLSSILELHASNGENNPQAQSQFLVLKRNVFSKLERLCVYAQDEKFIEECLPHLGPRCTELYLVNMNTFTPETVCRELMKQNNTNSITHLKLGHDIDKLDRILPRFDSLKSLDLVNLYSKSVPLVEVLWLLKRNCPRLTDLKLSGFVLNWMSQLNQINIPKLKHITSLAIKCFTRLQFETGANMNIRIDDFVCALAYIFPNLASLTLKKSETFFVGDPSNPITKQHFLPKMPQLRKLYIGSYWALEYTCYHLLSGHHRKRFFYENELDWVKVHFGNTCAVWCKDETSGLMKRILFR